MTHTNIKSGRLAAAIGLLVAVTVPVLLASHAQAAVFTQVMVRFDRMAASTATTGLVCARSATTGQTSVTVVFPTGFTVSGTTGNWATSTATTTGWPASAAAWPSIGATATTANAGSRTVTWASGSLPSTATTYCFNWTNTAALTTGSAGTGTGTVATNVDTTTSYSTEIIADDQIAVSATVPQAFTFALSGNTDALGTLSTSGVATSPTPRTVTINTNAKNGWQVWAKDANTGLTSPTASKTIASGQGATPVATNFTMASGSEGYNTGVTQTQVGGTGTLTVAAPFVGTAAGQGGGLDTTLRTLVTSTGTADTAVLTIKNNAAISGTTPAATDYADTITVVGAGLF